MEIIIIFNKGKKVELSIFKADVFINPIKNRIFYNRIPTQCKTIVYSCINKFQVINSSKIIHDYIRIMTYIY